MERVTPPENDPMLNKKRILCLHGGGTNAKIFRAQCRVLERWLLPTFRLCYAEAPFPSQAGSDVVSVYKKYGPFKAWLRWHPDDPDRDAKIAVNRISEALIAAMTEDDQKGATGEWVGLLGFSQGAKICASLLYAQQIRQELFGGSTAWPNFRFGVLLAGRGPLVSLMPEMPVPPHLVDASAISIASYDEAARTPTADFLRIPTIHLHGLRDPGIQLHRRLLYDYFDPQQARLLEWDGEHRVPIKSNDVYFLVQEILSLAFSTGVLQSPAINSI